MPILVQDVVTQMRAALDAEGADHYSDSRDIFPAINNSIRWLENVIISAFGQKKIGEEIFQDLSMSGVFRTSQYSRISFDEFPSTVWTILAVYALPVTDTNGNPAPATPSDKMSQYRPDLLHVRSTEQGAKRLTLEEWADNKDNPFEAGYEGTAFCPALKQRAYLNPINYGLVIPIPFTPITVLREIELRPAIDKGLVTIFWARNPTHIDALTDNIQFPYQVFQLLLDRALQFASWKQGDQTTLYMVTAQDMQLLINAML